MSMKDLDEAFRLLSQNAGTLHPRFVGPRPESMIVAAEQALGVRFPPTYRRFVSEFGCGSFTGTYVYGLGQSLDQPVAANTVWKTKQERKHRLPAAFVVVGAVGEGTSLALDLARRDPNEESPTVTWGLVSAEDHASEVVAVTFGAYLLERVRVALRAAADDLDPDDG